MSFIKLLKAPVKLFQKDVITFLIIRRFDLGFKHEILRYISVKPNASTSSIRQKIWHLLDLPDFCDELIILKTHGGLEISLNELKRGNTPEIPYILEVWLANNVERLERLPHMITSGAKKLSEKSICSLEAKQPIQTEKIEMTPKFIKPLNNVLQPEFKKPCDLSSRISNTSIFKINRKKSKDNFTGLLLKIQSDLSTLSNKLSVLENKIPTC